MTLSYFLFWTICCSVNIGFEIPHGLVLGLSITPPLFGTSSLSSLVLPIFTLPYTLLELASTSAIGFTPPKDVNKECIWNSYRTPTHQNVLLVSHNTLHIYTELPVHWDLLKRSTPYHPELQALASRTHQRMSKVCWLPL
jgi:hypothetical protein